MKGHPLPRLIARSHKRLRSSKIWRIQLKALVAFLHTHEARIFYIWKNCKRKVDAHYRSWGTKGQTIKYQEGLKVFVLRKTAKPVSSSYSPGTWKTAVKVTFIYIVIAVILNLAIAYRCVSSSIVLRIIGTTHFCPNLCTRHPVFHEILQALLSLEYALL